VEELMNKPTLMKARELREFLRDDVRRRTDFTQTDQALGVDMPPVQKPLAQGERLLPLPEWRGAVHPRGTLDELIGNRKSVRKYLDEPLAAAELSFLLWATQGVRRRTPGHVLRNVPSAGNRHSTETYLALTRVAVTAEGTAAFSPGLYRYAPLEHALLFLGCPERLEERVTHAALEQPFAGAAPVVFFWACLPYRTEWRYAEASHKVIAIDQGHICQNLYLAAGAIGCGTCAIAAYRQQAADALFGLDGQDEFIVYLAALGKAR
jgi:SagB-type dehydrogenase family enzyme